MSDNLVFRAGAKALRSIRRHGLRPEMVKVILGAAGGPRWLVLHGLDRVIFSSWFKGRSEPLYLLGSSIGSWRFAAVSQNNPVEALDRFLSSYIGQRYSQDPTPEEITLQASKMLSTLLGPCGAGEILNHPFLRLHVVAAHCKWPVASDNSLLLSLGLMDAAIYNAVHSGGLKYFFDRALFFDPRDVPRFAETVEVFAKRAALSAQNLKPALLASASIPLLMQGVRNIPGAPEGTYRDGGVMDYHFDLPLLEDDEDEDRMVLFPHYMDRIIPGWFDKGLPWRKPHASNMDRVLLVSPSKEFIERLPNKKIPDRDDFTLFKGRDEDRVAYWNEVIEAGACLGEDLQQAVETGAIAEFVQPID
ncbi:MAG: hypothetical protein WAW37_06750 [Syntrophobacteraceae bacterium]